MSKRNNEGSLKRYLPKIIKKFPRYKPTREDQAPNIFTISQSIEYEHINGIVNISFIN